MIKKYHNRKPQTNHRHREEEPHNNHETLGRKAMQSRQLSLPHQDDCKTRMDIKQRTTLHNPTLGVTINNESTTTDPPPKTDIRSLRSLLTPITIILE